MTKGDTVEIKYTGYKVKGTYLALSKGYHIIQKGNVYYLVKQ